MSPEFWAIIGVGVSGIIAAIALAGIIVTGQARSYAERNAIRSDLHRIETSFGDRLARIEQALFGPPVKISNRTRRSNLRHPI